MNSKRNLCLLLAALGVFAARAETVSTDLLIVGGTESGWAAAIQAARTGVKAITIVHDGEWLGGQYTEQGLACVDENKGVGKVGWGVNWHPMKRSFHRSGLFKELMDRVEAFNEGKYGAKMPGRPFHGPSTFRPAEAEAIFRELLQPYVSSGQVRLLKYYFPVAAFKTPDGRRLTGLRFQSLKGGPELTVHAALTIDASDWGEAVQVSGAAFEVGADPRSRYGEPSAAEDDGSNPPNEMNPITWALIVEQSAGETPVPAPPQYDERRYLRGTPLGRKEAAALKWDRPVRGGGTQPWPLAGNAATRQASVLTMRQLVDGGASKDGVTSALICYSVAQDYPLERLPRHVADALEATEPGASRKNLVLMNRAQREIVFVDAKAHSLGLLHHLQTFVHDRSPDTTHSLRRYHLSAEFGTLDHLPPKPYIREGLRLRALYMMREQDGLNTDGKSKTSAQEAFARVMYPDGIFCWQFHYDFHNTGRAYLKGEDGSSPWADYEKPGRGVHLLSDRSVFPLRSLVPVKLDGLLGAQGNVGFSSIVSSAIRLHDQRVHLGQAVGATAAVCLQRNLQPREIPYDRTRMEEVRHALCGGTKGVPLLLWPYRDLPANHPAFVAINRLAARGLVPLVRREVDFQPNAPATEDWRKALLELAACYQFVAPTVPVAAKLTRGDFAQLVWTLLKAQTPPAWPRLSTADADMDGIPDLDDALPFTKAKQSWLEKESTRADSPP